MKKVLSFILAVVLALSVYSEVAVAQFGGAGAFGQCADYLRVLGTSIIPNKTATYNLGSASKTFNTIYAGTMSVSSYIIASTGYVGLSNTEGRIVFTNAAVDLLNFLTCAVKIGAGTPTVTQSADDLYVTGDFEIDGHGYFADLTSGRVTIATTNGQLTDDADFTFSGSTLTLGSTGTGQDGALALASEQGTTDYTATLLANTAMTSAASFYLPTDEPAATSLMTMTTGGVMTNQSTSAGLAGALSDETGTDYVVFSNTPTLVTPHLGTPADGVLTNCTGTASGLTAGNVTTNANLTGDVVSTGNATVQTKWDTGNVWYVPLAGSIADAITAATDGDTLILAAGTYTVSDDIDVGKSVNIVGQGIGKTTVTCATVGKRIFHITSSNVRIADMTIAVTEGNAASAALYIDGTSADIIGIVIENCVISETHSAAAMYYCVVAFDASGTIRDCTITTNVSGYATGFYAQAASTTSSAMEWNLYNTSIKSTSGATLSYALQSYTVEGAFAVTVNCYDCNITATGVGNQYAAYARRDTSGTVNLNLYNSTLNGGTQDVIADASATLKLSGSTLVNNKISGTVDFGTNDAWAAWTPTLTWGTDNPTLLGTIARYKVANGICYVHMWIPWSDSNATTSLTFTLPIMPKDTNSYPKLFGTEKNNGLVSIIGPYIDAITPSITAGIEIFVTGTDDTAGDVCMDGFYEI
jgi:hypothetical protein